jgi:hypothetical protein
VHLITERAFSQRGEHKEEERMEKCSFSNAIIALSQAQPGAGRRGKMSVDKVVVTE